MYNIEIFEDIGRATVISMLDLADENPISRVPKSIYKDIDNMRIELSLQNNINVAQAKLKKEQLLRKRIDEQEKGKGRKPNYPKASRKIVLTPNTGERISKMHRGQS